MKYFLLIFAVLFLSCEKYHQVETPVKGVVISRNYTEAYDKYEYHYGYSVWKGKFCYHYGNNHHDAEYSTEIAVDMTIQEYGSRSVYEQTAEGDTIAMIRTTSIRDKDNVIIDIDYRIR